MFPARSRAVVRHISSTAPALTLLSEAIREVASRRRLIRYLVQADMKKRGSDTVLGNVWWILDPLLQMAVYLVFVSIIARSQAKDYPLFIFAAILPWKWYSSVVADSTTSVVRQGQLIRQIAFPKLVLPIATATAGVVGFAWGLIPLIGVMFLYPDRITPMLLWVPVIAVVQYAFSIATAILLSALNVFFRDLGNVAGHVLRLWWFLSPSLYSLATFENLKFVQDRAYLKVVFRLNPFSILFEAYRSVIYGTSDGGLPVPPDVVSLVALFLVSVVLIGLAAIFFKRVEPDFAKVL
ncbi:MAG TPA: ABC transporter permease [Candidatus Dormibacteraeota bacterium]|nr:ABC transporter permease [Candidatus Dormibacteraeota bacterium]